MTSKEKTPLQLLVLTAMMMCLVMVMTFIIRVPVPATQGYIHLGDSMIFVGVIVLGWKYGGVAAGLGSAMADLMAGYPMYVPVTLVVKGVMAVIVGLVIDYAIKKDFSPVKRRVAEFFAMGLGGLFMCGGYYIAESIMYGNWIIPIGAIGMNVIQFVVGMALAFVLVTALAKTPASKVFAYNLN